MVEPRNSIDSAAVPKPGPRTLAIIANPISGGGRPFRKIRRYVQTWPHSAWNVEILPTNCPEHAGELAHELLQNPPDLLAVCGGDGTVNEVASRVPDPPFPVALLPAGTANVLARELGIPLDPLRALDIALRGTVRRLDIGVAKGRTVHRFLLMAGAGFDAYVVAKVRRGLKWRAGKLAFYVSALQSLSQYHFPQFEVGAEGETLSATTCVVANCRGYGGGLLLTPEADMSDGLLDVLVVQGRNRRRYLRLLMSAWLRKPQKFPWIQQRRARTVTIRGPRGPWVHVDGELMGTLPVEITALPSSFPLIVP
jgi:diacylglycerol kinase (ATP)